MIRVLATVLGLLGLAVAAAGMAVRFLPLSNQPLLIAAAAAPYLLLAAPVSAVLLLVGRRWLLVVVAVALTVATVLLYLPRYRAPAAAQLPTVSVRVLTTNLAMGQVDTASYSALAGQRADIVAVQEMTPQAAAGLSRAGLDTVFPYRVIVPAEVASGIGIWSRFPIVDSGRIDGYSLPMIGTRIRIPGVRVDATVLSVHLAAPWPQDIRHWRDDIARLPQTLSELGRTAGAGAVIVAGDYNSTADMAPFRALLTGGYSNAVAGGGLLRTYPQNRFVPPLLGIDHILVKNADAQSVSTVDVAGTDHLGLLATVRLPVDMTAS
ncbi:endonuclease/exonuclease/phosphatase family protein [Mycolicibacterium sp. 018/SC-01/001]|uniref:endonuclease/exonuclease/phosphatase family protein n=1 Tax=Mycolicibacterium sp. 018/SC-01/001 TaxID=2592069 RepID=UPI00117CF6C1|nr:endonuclease/exonuclease/phosphatase family protein [Mycolicibacterium sp. 018/SC-01/001]TRW82703.1 endonuclease/exonuclease/phosphatase family protein [Mycolicibacterium sp. 018/SC-01/001]